MYNEIELEERVESLETILGQFIVQTNTSITRLEREMRVFKNEMKDFKDEMKDFKDEMKDFKTESIRERRAMNKQWGELANKMGTLMEDIVAPAVRPVVEKYFNVEIMDMMINRKKKDKILGLAGEFDVIAVSEKYLFLVETKSTPKIQYLHEFMNNIEKFKKLFPEYMDKKLIPIFASLRFENDIIAMANELELFLLAYREWDYMDILNFDEISARMR
ncbi:restriction endonuclease type II domain-containing protein [Desulfonema limicola]|uniref:Restriction endonuclease type II domain-containing protein n=1 Tax=Desulfonema limicola TaxID=45656 RepID=A0A975B5L8_9BACT|nr:hypothetical protein [Desulfonema limicola]QTA79179.1 restriction endonuclease type II domain-containing protein [Desulfonema limicola]